MPASMLAFGSNGLRTLYSRAVDGISCISPIAPLRERALGRYPDSTWIRARTSIGSTPWASDTDAMISP